jgi:glucoamylase
MKHQPFKIHRYTLLLFAFLLYTNLIFAQTNNAPGAPGKDANWSTAGKQAIGTSASLESKVWFTLAQGALTEVYYPDVTVANVHKLEFVVVNPKTKKVETETTDATHEIKPTRVDSLTFQQINTAKSGEWKITKTYTTDIKRHTVLIDVQFETSNQELNLYVYFDSSIGNTGMHDSAFSGKDFLYSEDGDKSVALVFTSKIEEQTSGFYQVSDGLEQLRQFGKIVNQYKKAENGNVAQMAKIKQPKQFTAVVSFASDFKKSFVKIDSANIAILQGYKSRSKGFVKSQAEYEKEWSDYVKTLPKVEAKYQAQFNMAAMVLKAQEDKTVRGANVASLTIPWGGGANANEDVGGGYHLVWSRDLYQVVTAYMALGDVAAANRALDFLFKIQQKPDGSFPQNSWLDGKKGWGSLQLDEVAYPLIMAYQLKRFDKTTYENHVKKAADFLVKTGPKTPQERWEEKSGYSPSTIAAEIAGLVCAAEIAKKNGDEASANIYLATADDWARNVERWTVTTNGKYGDGNYYIRLTENGTPDAKEKTVLNNGAGTFIENEIVDAGFLELVRLGIKSPDDPLIVKSLKVIDEQIRVKTPNGEAFYRYNHDGYGEMDDGRRWNWDGKYTGKGRLWALLAGERGQYELALATNAIAKLPKRKPLSMEEDTPQELLSETEYLLNLDRAKNRLNAMANFANDGLMIPEQIWDKADVPKDVDKQFIPELKFGEGTGSATPLAWSMAQFIRLAVNLKEGRNLDTPDVVYNRYKNGIPTKSNFGSVRVYQQILNDARIEIKVYFSTAPQNRVFVLHKDKSFEVTKNASEELSFSTVIAWSQETLPKENEKIRFVIKNPKDEMQLGTAELKPAYENYENEVLPKEIAEKLSKATKSPVIIGDKAYFIYRNEINYSEIMGDFNGWREERHNWSTISDVNGDYRRGTKFYWIKFPPNARVEYKVRGNGLEWITDPLNPNKIDNGVGGENSFFTMPDYKPTDLDKGGDAFLDNIDFKSQIFNGVRLVQTYVPTECVKTDCSVLYFQDGTDYIKRGKAVQVQQNLVKAAKIKPFIMVFVDPRERTKEYWANDDYAKFLATEVVPAIDAKYKTIKSRDGRAILGASLGGITSVHTALKYPEIFSRVGGQSSSFWVDDERVVKELEKLDGKTKYIFYFDDGTFEGVDDSRRVNVMLRGKGFDVTYVEGETGHNWTAWRDRLADAFITLWK